MTYDMSRIEIASDGVVTRGGLRLGVMTFDSISARLDATGEHFAENGDLIDDDGNCVVCGPAE